MQQEKTQNRMLSVKELLAQQRCGRFSKDMYTLYHIYIFCKCRVAFGRLKKGEGVFTAIIISHYHQLEILHTIITLSFPNDHCNAFTTSTDRYRPKQPCIAQFNSINKSVVIVLYGFVMSPLSPFQTKGCADTFNSLPLSISVVGRSTNSDVVPGQ